MSASAQPRKSRAAIRESDAHRRERLVGCIALAVLVLAAFLPAFRAGYVWDDAAVWQNPILSGWRGLVQIWFAPAANTFEEHYWPLTYTVHWVGRQVWGTAAAGFHAVNILLHAANACLVFLLLRRLAVPGAWLAAALFALHPLRVESVAWIVELKDVLSALFYLLAFLAYLQYDATTRRNWLGWACGFLACAMLSKSMAATLPAAILLALWWKRGALTRRDLLGVLPLLVIAMVLATVDFLVVRRLQKIEIPLSAIERLQVSGNALWFYFAKFLWPANQMAIYPRWNLAETRSLGLIAAASAAAILVALLVLRNKLGRGPFASTAYFAGTLLPVLGLVSFSYMEYTFVADRFTYLASIGLCALVGSAVWTNFQNQSARRIATIGLLLPCVILTFRRCLTYRDMETLFRDNVTRAPGVWAAHFNLARALGEKRSFAESIKAYETTLALKPDHANAHEGLGVVLARADRPAEAIPHYREAIKLKPKDPVTRSNLAAALVQSAQLKEAAEVLAEALRLFPEDERLRAMGEDVIKRLGKPQ
ncbi:MAG: tetratricopeptide repeat protein [Candidatus Sumerlaeaceae bacterium]|nr:tetratricopeptide repeat protein [Candidatus Sumerlaeaceae bacterium]